MSNLKTKLAEIKALCDAATEGPWKPIDEQRDTEVFHHVVKRMRSDRGWIYIAGETELRDTLFIAQSRTLLPQLIKCVEVLGAALKCNETYHILGGIDDCEPCKAKKQAEEILGGDNDRGEG